MGLICENNLVESFKRHVGQGGIDGRDIDQEEDRSRRGLDTDDCFGDFQTRCDGLRHDGRFVLIPIGQVALHYDAHAHLVQRNELGAGCGRRSI